MVSKTLVLVGPGKFGQKYISTLNTDFSNVNLLIGTRDNWKQLIDDKPDGVIVCTPPDSHIEIASYALERNIPTLIEKPLALSVSEVEKLSVFTAPIMVNYIDLFSDNFNNLKSQINEYEVLSVSVEISGSGPVREYSSLWDYGPHAIASFLTLTKQTSGNIIFNKNNGFLPDTYIYKIDFEFQNFVGTCIFGNGGCKKTRSYKIQTLNKTLELDNTKHKRQPLYNVINSFLSLINGEKILYSGLELSLQVTKILEFVDKLLK